MDVVFFLPFIKRLVYLITVVCAVWFCARSLHYPHYVWLVWSAFTFSLITLGYTFLQRIIVISLTGVIATAAALLAAQLAFSLLDLAVYLLVLTLGRVYFSHRYPMYFFPAFLVNLFAMLAGAMMVSSPAYPFLPLYMLLGLVVAVLTQVIAWPYFVKHELQFYLRAVFTQLKQLNRELFSCYLEADYKNNIYLYERRIHLTKNKWMMTMARLYALSPYIKVNTNGEKRQAISLLLERLQYVYDTMLDCAQLRRRVSDHTLFAVCAQELMAVSAAIDQSLTHSMNHLVYQKKYQSAIFLLEKINQFEDINQNVLQVTAHEPLVLILFIAGLKALAEELKMVDEQSIKGGVIA